MGVQKSDMDVDSMPRRNKGIINTIEVILVLLVVFVSFNIFFPDTAISHDWTDAYAFLSSRDLISALASSGEIHTYMSNDTKMQILLNGLFPESNLIFWYKLDGIQDEILVACNCTRPQIEEMNRWARSLRVNDRDITMVFCNATLEDMSSTCVKNSDAMLILEDVKISNYLDKLLLYLEEDKGLVTVSDLSYGLDAATTQLFGIDSGGNGGDENNTMTEPDTYIELGQEPRKYFYDIPIALIADDTTTDLTDVCTTVWRGNFTIREEDHGYWICDGNELYINSQGPGLPPDINNTPTDGLQLEDQFELEDHSFKFSYLDSSSQFRLTFLENTTYKFVDFIEDSDGPDIITNDGDETRILVRMGGSNYNNDICGVVLNNVSLSRVAWVSNFARPPNDITTVGDDHKQLLMSLLLWSSKKAKQSGYVENLEKGFTNSYISVKNIDVFEILKYNIGVGYPY